MRFVPVATWALIAINALAFGAEWRATDPTALIDAFAAVPYDITHGVVLPPPSPPSPYLTILTAMFVHGGIAHVAANLIVLALFGPAVESRCGHLRFAAFYLTCGIAGELAQIAMGPGSHLPAIGASGAIAGVLGGYVMSYPLHWPAVLGICAWAAAQFAGGGSASFIHLGGFACGVFLIGAFRRPDAGMRASPW